ncbi:CPBP family intramembrane glutamic endopeptidase [Gracilimonas sp.]|uniref:CPBP family intramembrane glutamic endopeptidase n=1 Tax=Gracilimonas sp. TaxID=1974203 RepID=UPI00287223B8|nr:type II CAAX endopeptidase family protein [Gracilimonas sp.]
MQNLFYNAEENRMRALFRVLLFIILFFLASGLPLLIPIEPISYLLQSVLSFGVFYLMIRFTDKRPWQFSGLQLNSTWAKECIAGIAIAAFVMGLIFLGVWGTGGLEITGFGWERNTERSWLIPLLIFLVQMMSVGFYEEVMARGYLIPNITEGFTFDNFSARKATVFAILISSSFFGILHAGNPNATLTAVSNIILAGVMLAIPFVVTGRLALSIGLHFSWNFFQGGVFGFRVSGMEIRSSIIQVQQGGPDWWTGGAFGPEAGVIGILGILLIIIMSVGYLKFTGVQLNLNKVFSSPYKKLKNADQEVQKTNVDN